MQDLVQHCLSSHHNNKLIKRLDLQSLNNKKPIPLPLLNTHLSSFGYTLSPLSNKHYTLTSTIPRSLHTKLSIILSILQPTLELALLVRYLQPLDISIQEIEYYVKLQYLQKSSVQDSVFICWGVRSFVEFKEWKEFVLEFYEEEDRERVGKSFGSCVVESE